MMRGEAIPPNVDDEIPAFEVLKHMSDEALHLAALAERLDDALGRMDGKAAGADTDLIATLQNMDYLRQGIQAVAALTRNLSACFEAQPDATVSRSDVSAGVGPKNILDRCLAGPDATQDPAYKLQTNAVAGDFVEL